MFGWEFPPHISGGLGTACYGLTKGLLSLEEVEVTFVVPRVFGDENSAGMKLIGANTIPVLKDDPIWDDLQGRLKYIEADAAIVPYLNEDDYLKLKKERYPKGVKFIQTDHGYRIDFSGTYVKDLYEEIRNYSVIAERIAREEDFDIIHAHDWLAYPAGIRAMRVSGKPLVVHVHATDFDRSGGEVNPRVYAIEREGMEQAHQVISVSNLTRRTVIEKYGIDPGKVKTVYNAVEKQEAEPQRSVQVNAAGDKLVTFLGRVTTQKGPEYFIEAAHMVLQRRKDVRFVMAGSGDLWTSMIERVAELGIADRFHFTGFLDSNEVEDLFAQTHVFVMPSTSEPFGIVPLEAMRNGVPVIISKQSGVSEVINYAIKIDFWDIQGMSDAIYGLLSYDSLGETLGQGGEKEVRSIKWSDSAKNTLQVYKEVLENYNS